MENGGWVAILILVVLVGGVNLAMYGLVRGAFRGENKGVIDALGKSLNVMKEKDKDIEELRRRLEEIEKGKKNKNGESKN
jgi:hypothetical protein